MAASGNGLEHTTDSLHLPYKRLSTLLNNGRLRHERVIRIVNAANLAGATMKRFRDVINQRVFIRTGLVDLENHARNELSKEARDCLEEEMVESTKEKIRLELESWAIEREESWDFLDRNTNALERIADILEALGDKLLEPSDYEPEDE